MRLDRMGWRPGLQPTTSVFFFFATALTLLGCGPTTFSIPSASNIANQLNHDINSSVSNLTFSEQVNPTKTAKKKGLQPYSGPRHKVTQGGTECAAMPFTAVDIKPEVARIMDELLLGELQQAGFSAIGPDDVNAMLGLERSKEAVGCNDASCLADVGGALGVRYLVAGKIAALSGAPVLTLKLLDVHESKVLARTTKMGQSSMNELPWMIGAAVQDLVQATRL